MCSLIKNKKDSFFKTSKVVQTSSGRICRAPRASTQILITTMVVLILGSSIPVTQYDLSINYNVHHAMAHPRGNNPPNH